MYLKINLAIIKPTDTIVVANNRQVLAFKNSFSKQHPDTQLPNIFSWQQYLKNYWKTQHFGHKSRLIDTIEQRYLLEFSLKSCGQDTHNQLINEVVKNYGYCVNHLIKLSTLANSKIQICEVFAQWITHYQQNKQRLNLLDEFDIPSLILADKNISTTPYIYGFKTPTLLSIVLPFNFSIRSCQPLNSSSRPSSSGLAQSLPKTTAISKTLKAA